MKSITDLLAAIFDTSKERIKNPLIGTFILSWLVINWQPLFILLFSAKTIEEKIKVIKTDHNSLIYSIGIPILIALIYVLVLPYFFWLMDYLVKKAVEGRKDNHIDQQLSDIKGKQKLAKEEVALEDIKSNYREKADLNRQIEKLSSEIQEKERLGGELVEKLQKLEDLFEENQIENKNFIANRNKTIEELEGEIAHLKMEKEIFNSDNEIDDGWENIESNYVKAEYISFTKSPLFNFFPRIGDNVYNYNSFPDKIDNIVKEKYIIEEIIMKDYFDERFTYRLTKKGEAFWKLFVKEAEIPNNKIIKEEEEEDLPF